VTAAKIANGTLTNTQISASAAIAYSKLNLASSIVNGDVSSSAAIAYSKLALGGSIINTDVASGANIAYSKLNLANSIVNSDVAAGANIAYSKLNLAGSITNSDVSATAAIAYNKLNLSNSIVNSDIATGANIAYNKLNLSGSIVNSDISSSAAIAYSKLATLNTGQIVVGSAGTPTAVTLGGDATINASGNLTIANNAITTAKIADSQITTAKLASGAIPEIIGGTSGAAMANGATSFMGMFSVANATESAVQVPVQTSGTISNFDVRITAAAGALPNAWAFTLRKNGASTAITCTISGTTATQCADNSDTVSFASGDLLSIQVVPTSAPTNTAIGRWTAKLSTP
jgi:hypothetical protein